MIALLPGPPRELKPLFLEQVFPRLQRRVSGVRMFHRELRVTGLGESHVEERVRPIYTRYSGVSTTILAAPGEVQIHLRAWSDDAAQTNTTLDEMVRSFELALGDRIFAHSGCLSRTNRRRNSRHESRHHCGGGKLHRRLACRTPDAYPRQLQLFSGRSGLLQQ